MLFKTFLTVFTFLILLFLNFIEWSVLKNFLILCQLLFVVLILVHISWFLTEILHNFWQHQYISPLNRAVLITGCDSGFGHEVCYKLDSYGFHVFAGVLFPCSDSSSRLQKKCSERLKIIKLDVTEIEDVKTCVKEIEASGLVLWAVLNNAGINCVSKIEMGYDVEEFEKIFAVNVFGLVRVTKHCLPLLRKSGGRVINMSSFAGRFSSPGMTAYSMSKFAVRSFSNGLRRELTSFGVKVITIEPFLYKTPLSDANLLIKSFEQIWLRTDPKVRDDYGGDLYCEKLKSSLKYITTASRTQIHEVIDAQEKAIILCKPNLYYKCAGPVMKFLLWAFGLFSETIHDWILSESIYKNVLRSFRKIALN